MKIMPVIFVAASVSMSASAQALEKNPYGELRLYAYADQNDSVLSGNPIIQSFIRDGNIKTVKTDKAARRKIFKKRTVKYAKHKKYVAHKYVRRAVRYKNKSVTFATTPLYEAIDAKARRAMGGMQPSSVSYMSYSSAPTSRVEIIGMIKEAARKEGVDEHFALAVAYHENGYKPRGVSHAGAIGPMQVMPGTARLYDKSITREKLADPRVNIPIGMRYLRDAIRSANGDKHAAAARYEAGIGSGRVDSKYAQAVKSLHKNRHVLAALHGRDSSAFSSAYNYGYGEITVSAYRPEGN